MNSRIAMKRVAKLYGLRQSKINT